MNHHIYFCNWIARTNRLTSNAFYYIDGKDYTLNLQTLAFSALSTPGNAIVCSTLSIIDDNVLENTEMFYTSLTSNDSSAVIRMLYSETIITIMEDNTDSEQPISFSCQVQHKSHISLPL